MSDLIISLIIIIIIKTHQNSEATSMVTVSVLSALLVPTSSGNSFIPRTVLVDRSLYLFYLTLHCSEFHASVSSTVIWDEANGIFKSDRIGKGAKRSKFAVTVKPLLPLWRCPTGYRYWEHVQGPCHCHLQHGSNLHPLHELLIWSSSSLAMQL